MVYSPLTIKLLIVFAVLSTTCFGQDQKVKDKTAKSADKQDDGKDKKKKQLSKVDRLFESMHDMTFRGRATFPKLTWEDIPDLVKRTKSVHQLHVFPVNPISSMAYRQRREGMVAAWLIEGIRAGGKYPSLNASCAAGRVEVEVERLSKFYGDWWKKVKGMKPDKARKHNPLANTDLHWR